MSTGTMPRPRRGVPYYDATLGRMRVLPRGGGPVSDYVRTPPAGGFDARRTLRQAGFEARATARQGADLGRQGVASFQSAAAPADPGWWGLLVYAFGTIIGLALLEAALGGRGPAAVQLGLGGLTRAIRKLVDPTDTLVRRGTVPPAPPPGTAAGTAAPAPAAAGAATSPPAAPTAAGLVNPLSSVTLPRSWQGRTDQGLDLELGSSNVGRPILAPAPGIVRAVQPIAGFGPTYVAYDVTSGPLAGRSIFVGHSRAAVRVGQTVKAGDPLVYVAGGGEYGGEPGHVEIGWANPASAWRQPLGAAEAHSHPATHYSAAGQSFTDWLLALLRGG